MVSAVNLRPDIHRFPRHKDETFIGCCDYDDGDDDDDEDDEVGQGRKAISGVGRSPHTGDQHNPCVPAATMLPTNINFSFNINIKNNIKNKNNIVNLFLLYTRQEIYQKDLAGFLGKQFYTIKEH